MTGPTLAAGQGQRTDTEEARHGAHDPSASLGSSWELTEAPALWAGVGEAQVELPAPRLHFGGTLTDLHAQEGEGPVQHVGPRQADHTVWPPFEWLKQP